MGACARVALVLLILSASFGLAGCAALDGLNNDNEYHADAVKTLGFIPEYYAGADAASQVRSALTVRPEIRTFVADYIAKGAK